MSGHYVRFFEELGIEDVPLVGGKNASLGEMVRELGQKGILVPNGFAITAEAYWDILKEAGTGEKLHGILSGLQPEDVADLARRGAAARELLEEAPLPPGLETEILNGYEKLISQYGSELSVAVRSSATAEDLPTASFAGQQESYLNIRGREALIKACRRCFASLFTDRAISYRHNHHFDHFKVALSVGVMKMVRSDLGSSGVAFTLDTDSGFRDVVLVTGSWGLGENVVQGAVDPDEFFVHKPTYAKGYRCVLRKILGKKQQKMIYGEEEGSPTRNVPTTAEDAGRFCLSDEEVLELAGHTMVIEEHYTRKARVDRPMDVEWAKDGVDGKIYIVQARPETVVSQRQAHVIEEFHIRATASPILTGRAVGTRVAQGKVRVVRRLSELPSFEPGEVLVADMTTPDWEPVMKRSSAIITNRGGRTCHAAIVARELGIPAVVGVAGATETLSTAEEVTVSCAEGETGKIYRGRVDFEVKKTDLAAMPRPRTKIMLNIGNPELAFMQSALPVDGVGLARMEFIFTNAIKGHPMALLHPEKVQDPKERELLQDLAKNDPTAADFVVRELAQGVGTIAAAFYPKPVVVRLSDFKTNEYRAMVGGTAFEPEESNPMLGLRGASRYLHPLYAEAFALECKAMKVVREKMGLTNVKLMIPFCRMVEEGRRVVALMEELGLKRGENGLEIYVMCEIPNNALQVDAFAGIFDGFSIGSNDLAQLTLGVDRDSGLVAQDFDERDPGVLMLMERAIQGAKRHGRYSGICGQAPSDYPEVAEFLVRHGIGSMSLNPDTVLKTTLRVLELEKELFGSA